MTTPCACPLPLVTDELGTYCQGCGKAAAYGQSQIPDAKLTEQLAAVKGDPHWIMSCAACRKREVAVGRGHCEACIEDNVERGED